MRIFTAIPLPDEIKEKFGQIARGKLPIPYVNTDLLHITLHFLGDLDTDREKLAKKLWFELPTFKKVDIEFDKLIKFQHQIHMTLVDNPVLVKLQGDMRREFEKLGFTFTFPKYYPHVTIGSLHMDRVMHRERRIEDFPNQELKQLSFTADKIVMFESKQLLHHTHHFPISERALE